MTASSIAALFGTMFILAVAPGPSDIAIVARSIAAGLRPGLLMVGGIVVADMLFILLAVYSLSEVATALGGLFTFIKIACGLYLIWLGMGPWRTASDPATDIEASPATHTDFLTGLFITLGDPKAILFYLGLLPAFIDLQQITPADIAIIVLIATLVVGGVKSGYAFFAHRATALLSNRTLRRTIDRLAGLVLMGTGLFLILTEAWFNPV